MTVSDDFVIDPEYGLTCQDYVDYGLYNETDGSDTCDRLKSWEALCCPTVDDPCTFCPNGLSSGYEDFIPYPEYGTTYPCKDMVYFAATYESDSEMCRTLRAVSLLPLSIRDEPNRFRKAYFVMNENENVRFTPLTLIYGVRTACGGSIYHFMHT